MILYGSRMSPFVRKVLFAASAKGIALDLRAARASGDAFLAVSPFGKMPALQDGEFSISDSTAILAYLEEDGPALLPADRRDRARAIWIEEFADTLLIPSINKIFWQRFVHPRLMGKAGDVAMADAVERDEMPRFFAYIETIAPLEGFLLGPAPTLADIALFGGLYNYVGYCTADLDASLYPRAASLAARFYAHAPFAAVLEQEAAERDAALAASARTVA